MRGCISKFAYLSVVLIVFAAGTTAQADFHATANVQGGGFLDTESGALSATAQGSFRSSFQDVYSFGSGSATSQGLPGVSGVLVTGSSTNNDPVPVKTQAEWQDTLSLRGPAGTVLPDYVDLYFHAGGTITYSSYAGGTIGVKGTNGYSFYQFGYFGENLNNSGFWDSVQYGDGHLDGTWHERVFLGSPDAQGNRTGDWFVGYYTQTDTSYGGYRDIFATVNGNDPPTFSFDAVRLADGRTPEEAGLSLTFGSGILSPNVVPEPSSVVMLGIGTVGLLGSAWLRRKRNRA